MRLRLVPPLMVALLAVIGCAGDDRYPCDDPISSAKEENPDEGHGHPDCSASKTVDTSGQTDG